jgi:PKHD-type hydroxylase
MWDAFNYCEIFAGRFTAEECERVIALHQGSGIVQSRIPRGGDGLIRDSDLFWVPRTPETGWVFERLCDVAALYNARYGFELCAEMGQLQLTRYRAGQLYDWHMDLGSGAMSLRKITIVVELAAGQYQGGGTEVFYGEGRENRVALGQGAALVFPSFIMHRALPVENGARWTLVSWLTGPAPLT